MSPASQTQTPANEEAAQWFARLNAVSISTQELNAFRSWRSDPKNQAAYTALEQIWRSSRGLDHDPDIQAALQAARGRKRRPPLWVWPLGLFAGAGVAALAAAAAVIVFIHPGAQTYQTAIGEQSTVVLEDGSRVQLDTDSRLEVRYAPAERRLALVKGQADFDVVHLPTRPFRVQVGDTMVRDLGTRFDIRKDAEQVRVTVMAGSVQVEERGRADPWTLTTGQQVLTGHGVRAPYPVDTARATSWTIGRLIFEDTPLAAVAAEMNRYGHHKLKLPDAGVGQIKVSGAFDSGDTNAFVIAVEHLYDLRAAPQPDGSILLAPATLDPTGQQK